MGLFKQIFGDNRVLTAKDPDVQRVITYMNETYEAYIQEYSDRRRTVYYVRCGSKKLFDVLYRKGLLDGGSIRIPGMGKVFESKVAAFEGLLWLRDYLDELTSNRALDDKLF